MIHTHFDLESESSTDKIDLKLELKPVVRQILEAKSKVITDSIDSSKRHQ